MRSSPARCGRSFRICEPEADGGWEKSWRAHEVSSTSTFPSLPHNHTTLLTQHVTCTSTHKNASSRSSSVWRSLSCHTTSPAVLTHGLCRRLKRPPSTEATEEKRQEPLHSTLPSRRNLRQWILADSGGASISLRVMICASIAGVLISLRVTIYAVSFTRRACSLCCSRVGHARSSPDSASRTTLARRFARQSQLPRTDQYCR